MDVAVDGRRETVYPDDVYRENLAFMFGADGWEQLLARGGPRWRWWTGHGQPSD